MKKIRDIKNNIDTETVLDKIDSKYKTIRKGN